MHAEQSVIYLVEISWITKQNSYYFHCAVFTLAFKASAAVAQPLGEEQMPFSLAAKGKLAATTYLVKTLHPCR